MCKYYIVVFVYFTAETIYLEFVTYFTSEAFIVAFIGVLYRNMVDQ